MATRSTMAEAEQLKAQFEANFPGATFVINDVSTSRFTSYDVVEQRTCRTCGAVYTTIAVGEGDAECRECKQKRIAEFNAQIAEHGRQARERNAWSKFHDTQIN